MLCEAINHSGLIDLTGNSNCSGLIHLTGNSKVSLKIEIDAVD